jgi:hypothetical protein
MLRGQEPVRTILPGSDGPGLPSGLPPGASPGKHHPFARGPDGYSTTSSREHNIALAPSIRAGALWADEVWVQLQSREARSIGPWSGIPGVGGGHVFGPLRGVGVRLPV